MASHASAHVTHKLLGPAGVGVKGGLEAIALVVAKLKKASPRVMRGLRSSLRGTLCPFARDRASSVRVPLSRPTGTTTSGAEGEGDVGDAATDEDDAKNTDF